jgi:hypothetical protein
MDVPSRPCRFIPWERAPGIRWIGGWVDPRAGPDAVDKRLSYLYRDSNPDSYAILPEASRCDYVNKGL